jgi:chromosome segregation ATPase
LKALQTNNQKLGELLSESQADSQKAKELCRTLQEQVTTLQTQLAALQTENKQALTSLEIAQNDLNNAMESYRQSEANHQATENRLRNQRTLWQVIGGLLLVSNAFS